MRRWAGDQDGTAAIEFCLVAPVLLLMLFAILGFGGQFWRAHALQQVANDAARAAVPGLTAAERAALARATIGAELAGIAGIEPARVTVAIVESGEALTIALDYDGTNDPFFRLLAGIVAQPRLRRSGIVLLGAP